MRIERRRFDGIVILTFKGELDESNVRQRLAVRDLLEEIRGAGGVTGGPPPFGPKDKRRFANAIDRWITKHDRTELLPTPPVLD